MTNLAVEAPTSASATEGEKPIDTEAELRKIAEGTADDSTLQPDSTQDDDDNEDDDADSSPDGDEDDEDDTGDGDEPDADAESKRRFDEWTAAERERILEEGRQLERDALRDAAQTEHSTKQTEAARRKFPAAIDAYTAKAAELGIDPKLAEQLLDPIKTYNREAQEIHTELAYGELQEAFFAALPQDQHADYLTAVDNKPVDTWLEEYVERVAPAAKSVKASQEKFIKDLTADPAKTIDKLSELSPAVKAAIARLRTDEFDAGREKERKSPSREPRSDEAGAVSEDLPRDEKGNIDTRKALARIQRVPARR
ncbi:MAG: hypothetical protein AB7U95_37750 [Reyranella sp.]